MKRFILLTLFYFSLASIKAQTFEEWFRQKKTQQKYLVQQIAGLQVYIGYAKKGYAILDKGLGTIQSIKKGDLGLHEIFFNSLKKLNPRLSQFVLDLELESLKKRILERNKDNYSNAIKNDYLNADEKSFVQSSYLRVNQEIKDLDNDLSDLLGANQLQLSDAERMKKFLQLKSKYLSLYHFVESWEASIHFLSANRAKEIKELNTSRLLYGF